MDYPGYHSLLQIYGTFNRAMLRLVPSLRSFADPLTEAMVEFYLKSQVRQEVHVLHHSTSLSRNAGCSSHELMDIYRCTSASSGWFEYMLMECV